MVKLEFPSGAVKPCALNIRQNPLYSGWGNQLPRSAVSQEKNALLPEPCGVYCQGDSLHIRWSVQIPVTAFGSDPEF